MADETNIRDITATAHDADGNSVEVSDAELTRTRAFFTDTVDALTTAHDEGWDVSRTDAELTKVQRAHGYWTDTPVLGGKIGVDASLASVGLTGDATGAVGVEGTISLPATRDISRDTDAIEADAPARIEVSREGLLQISANTDNAVRAGVQFTFSGEVDLPGQKGLGVEGFLNHATDGTAQMGVGGSFLPGAIKGRYPVEFGASLTSDLIDTDTLIAQREGLFDDAIRKADAQGYGGQQWARDTLHDVLDEAGGSGKVPESKLILAASVAEFEAQDDREGSRRIQFQNDDKARVGVERLDIQISQAGDNEGFYRVTGASAFPPTDVRYGKHNQRFDAIIDRTGTVIDGYELEHRGGGQQIVFNESFGTARPWDGQFSERMDPSGFGPNATDLQRQYDRNAYVKDRTTELDALEATDLIAAHPESAARHASAPWTVDRTKAAEIAAETSGEASLSAPLITPVLSTPALASHEVLSGSDYAWARRDHLPGLVEGDGSVEGVHLPEPARAGMGGLLERTKTRVGGLFRDDPPGLDIRELSEALSEASGEVRALDREAQGDIRTSPEGWRFGHPETQARWESLQRGFSDGSLRGMRISVDTQHPDGTPMTAHERADALLDAVDRGAAAYGQARGRVPRALSGPLSDYARDHPVPGSEEVLLSRGDAGAVARDSAREAEMENARRAAQDHSWIRSPEVDPADALNVGAEL